MITLVFKRGTGKGKGLKRSQLSSTARKEKLRKKVKTYEDVAQQDERWRGDSSVPVSKSKGVGGIPQKDRKATIERPEKWEREKGEKQF